MNVDVLGAAFSLGRTTLLCSLFRIPLVKKRSSYVKLITKRKLALADLKCIMLAATENEGIHDPNLFEGDMIFSKEQIRRAEAGEDIDSSRKRGSSRFGKWPNGTVIYAIDSSLSKF